MLRLEALWDHCRALGGYWNEHALHEPIDVSEGRNGEENFAIGPRRPQVLHSAHSDDQTTMCVFDTLGNSRDAAAEQQYSAADRRGRPQATRAPWLDARGPAA